MNIGFSPKNIKIIYVVFILNNILLPFKSHLAFSASNCQATFSMQPLGTKVLCQSDTQIECMSKSLSLSALTSSWTEKTILFTLLAKKENIYLSKKRILYKSEIDRWKDKKKEKNISHMFLVFAVRARERKSDNLLSQQVREMGGKKMYKLTQNDTFKYFHHANFFFFLFKTESWNTLGPTIMVIIIIISQRWCFTIGVYVTSDQEQVETKTVCFNTILT